MDHQDPLPETTLNRLLYALHESVMVAIDSVPGAPEWDDIDYDAYVQAAYRQIARSIA